MSNVGFLRSISTLPQYNSSVHATAEMSTEEMSAAVTRRYQQMHDPAQYAPLSAQFSAQPHIVGSDDALIFGAAAANMMRAKRPVIFVTNFLRKA